MLSLGNKPLLLIVIPTSLEYTTQRENQRDIKKFVKMYIFL